MQERHIVTADIGSSKIAVSIVKVEGEDIQVVYYKEQPSDGIRYGCVFNPSRAAESLRNALAAAEDELKIKIRRIVVNMPRHKVMQISAGASAERENPDSCITKNEITELKSKALESFPIKDPENEMIYGATAQSFSSDDQLMAPERDIIGTTSKILEGNFNVFVGAKKPCTNIDTMLNICGVEAAHRFFPPNILGRAVLRDDERENGVALIEIGAGVSSVSIYEDRILRYYNSIPFGGHNVTEDIKNECVISKTLSENIKMGFAACMPDKLQSLSEKQLRIKDGEGDSFKGIPLKYLSEIVTSRMSEIVKALLYMIQESGYADKLRSGVIITGGGANLTNLGLLIKEISGYNVKIGYPRCQMSIDGCSGIYDPGAVLSTAMILAAAKDKHLDCLEGSSKIRKEIRETTPNIVEFDVAEAKKEKEKEKVKEEPRTATKKESKLKITWKPILKKVEETLNIFDNME